MPTTHEKLKLIEWIISISDKELLDKLSAMRTEAERKNEMVLSSESTFASLQRVGLWPY